MSLEVECWRPTPHRRRPKANPEAFTEAQIVAVMRGLAANNGQLAIMDRDGNTPLFYLMAPEVVAHVQDRLDARKKIHLLRP